MPKAGRANGAFHGASHGRRQVGPRIQGSAADAPRTAFAGRAAAAVGRAEPMRTTTTVHPVDERLPLPLALQHVLVMYAGAVAVPLIIGRALRLPPRP